MTLKSQILLSIVLVLFNSQFIFSQTITATRLTDGSVTSYTCDGVDDHIQINQALDYVKDEGGTVELSAHTFYIDSALYFAGNNTTLQGMGIDQTTIKLIDNAGWCYYYQDGSGDWVLHVTGPMILNKKEATQHLSLKNLKIDGNKYNQYLYDPIEDDTIQDTPDNHVFDGQGHYVAVDIRKRSGSTQAVSDILISHVFIYENSDDGLVVRDGTNLTVEYCKGIRGGHSYVYFYDPINLLVRDCEFMVTSNSGIRWYDGNHIVIQGNHIYGEPEKTGNSNFCIEVTSGQSAIVLDDLIIENNNMEFTAGAAIALDAKESQSAKNAIIRNNVILQCGNSGTTENIRESGGINIKNFTNTLIENNTIVNCIGGGVRLGGNVGFNTEWPYETGLTAIITNNIITNTIEGGNSSASGYGIDVASGNRATCTYNNVWGNAEGDYFGCEPDIGSMSVDPKYKSIILGSYFHDTNDTTADLHLQSEMGRWNSNNSSWETDAESSICINAGNPNDDYSNEPATNGNRRNQGAYGNTNYASKGEKAPPVANAGPDLYIRDDNDDDIVFVELDGSLSTDNGTITSYSWERNGAEISTSEIDTVPFVLGAVNINLTVIDDDGISSIDRAFVKILPYGPNIDPIANAGEDKTVTDKDNNGIESVSLDGSDSYDPDAILVSYEWYENGFEISSGIEPEIDFSVGTHDVVLKVTDNEGGTDTDTIIVKVLPKGNYALEFSNDFNDEVVQTSNLPFYSTYTFEMWIKQKVATDDAALLWLGGDGKRAMLKTSTSYPSWDETTSNTASESIPLDSWHHLAFVVEDDSLTRIYIDGVSSAINSSTALQIPSALNIGSFYGTSDSYESNFVGIMDELRYWNVARTQAQINNKKDTVLNGNEEGLIGYWNFNDGSGNRLTDLTGIADGTLYNMEEEDWVTDTPPLVGSGKTYYIDFTNGDDSKNGTSITTAWKTVTKINNESSIFNPGDSILFKRNEVWTGTRLNIESVYGLEASNIVFGAYETGAKPILNTIETQMHTWTNVGGNIWKADNSPEEHPERMLIDGVEKLRANIQSELDGVNFFWRYDENTSELFIYSASDPNGITEVKYATDFPIIIGNSNNITLRDLDLQGGWTAMFIDSMSKNITIDSLNIGKYSADGIILNTESLVKSDFPGDIHVKNCNFDAYFTLDYSMAGTYIGSFDRGCGDGIRPEAFNGGDIYNCHFKNWGHASINLNGGEYFKVSNIKIYNNYLTSPDICYGGRMAVDDAFDIELYNNQIVNTSIQTQLNGHSNHYHHNIIDVVKNTPLLVDELGVGISISAYSSGDVKNNIYENNVILNTEGTGIQISGNNEQNIFDNTIKNNIIYNCGTTINGKSIEVEANLEGLTYNNSFLNNDIFNSTTTQSCDYRGTIYNVAGFNALDGTDGYVITGNIADIPLFVDEPNDDFHLQANSPCIDAGTDANSSRDYDNSPIPLMKKPDIGLYEKGIYWNGSISHYWNIAGNWSTGQVPVSTDIITIPKKEFYKYYPKLYNNTQIKGLYLNENAELRIMENKELEIEN